MKDVPQGEPWHLVVNFAGPHPPMDITKSMERSYRRPERVVDGFPQPHAYAGPFDASHHLRIRQNYAAMIENVDRWLGIYLEQLEERGELDNTIVIYASDHGEMLGDHSRWGKQLPYQASVGVPLIFAGPRVLAGVCSEALVSLMDVAATCLDYADVAVPEDMDSLSARPLLEGRTPELRQWVLSGLRDWRMVFDGRFKYLRGFDGEEETLFDLVDDPHKDVNLAAARPQESRRLRGLLRQETKRLQSAAA